MTAQALSTARPPRTAIAWVQGDDLFVEIPCKDGAPYIARYKKTVEGLQAALNVLLETSPAAPHAALAQAHPSVRRIAPQFNEAERAKVRDILKDLKIT